jgi:hypothetical protein
MEACGVSVIKQTIDGISDIADALFASARMATMNNLGESPREGGL